MCKTCLLKIEYFKDSSQDFNFGLNGILRLLDISSNIKDKTTILQAISHLIEEKLNSNEIKKISQSIPAQIKEVKNMV